MTCLSQFGTTRIIPECGKNRYRRSNYEGLKPEDFNPAFWTANKTANCEGRPETYFEDRIYKRLSRALSKVGCELERREGDERSRNMIRQLTAGIKESKLAAEMDRQRWIKDRAGHGNTENLKKLIIQPGLNKPIPI